MICEPVTSDQPQTNSDKIVKRALARDSRLSYFLYLPNRPLERAPVFVTVHGISRNAEEHARLFAPYCEKRGIVLVAPLFSAEVFSRYQRFGREGQGERSDKVLNEIISEVGAMTGASTEKFCLFGFSGGGQFVHRYTMAYPHRVIRYVVGAAGWYTFPDTLVRYPRGISPRKDLPDISFVPKDFLNVPGSVIVGERDIKVNRALNQSDKINRQQGINRVERGRRWINAMRSAARESHSSTPFDFHIIPRFGHSFSRGMMRCGMGAVVFNNLFDQAGTGIEA